MYIAKQDDWVCKCDRKVDTNAMRSVTAKGLFYYCPKCHRKLRWAVETSSAMDGHGGSDIGHGGR